MVDLARDTDGDRENNESPVRAALTLHRTGPKYRPDGVYWSSIADNFQVPSIFSMLTVRGPSALPEATPF
jgi:hypothetical protein